jgi:hypothetical protein
MNAIYQSYKNGGKRRIVLASVIAERDAAVARGPQLVRPPSPGKRPVGRPRKSRPDQPSQAAR